MKNKIRTNGSLWKDQEDNPIHAHGGFIIKYREYYYWYGEDRRDNYYVSCYRSKNLVDWEFRNHCLTSDSPTMGYRVRTKIQLINDDGNKVNIERPKVLFNEKTKKFVMWAHFENGRNYNDAAIAIATCDTPDGDFVYHGHFNPFGYMSRDCTLFKDDDGTAYFISAARDNADLHIYKLSDDYMNVEKLVHKLWQGEYREAPAVIKVNEEYLMITSFCTGWDPNQAKYSTAKSIEGNWSTLKDIGDETTFDSQASFLMKIDGAVIYFGDRWGGNNNYLNSGYVAYKLNKIDEIWTMKYSTEVEFSENGIIFR
ncbi:family 43 glycosylhydrolase [Fundicoccus sp. Sow4_H7]|uniref:family 43 glycosylhydrolase n=1 Tax=Fundicoccus sp. Sow4_H7 TaxID=3438784 RepID=UPI003F905A1C